MGGGNLDKRDKKQIRGYVNDFDKIFCSESGQNRE